MFPVALPLPPAGVLWLAALPAGLATLVVVSATAVGALVAAATAAVASVTSAPCSAISGTGMPIYPNALMSTTGIGIPGAISPAKGTTGVIPAVTGKNDRTTVSVFSLPFTDTPRKVRFFRRRSISISLASSSVSIVMNQVSPISERMDVTGLAPGKLNISFTSSSGASEGISLRMMVLRPGGLILALILLSMMDTMVES